MTTPMRNTWTCRRCHITFKGGPVHHTAATDTEPVYRYCSRCWDREKRT